MRTTSFAHRLSTLAIIIAGLLLSGPRPGSANPTAAPTSATAPAAASPAKPGPTPGTPAEAARFAERERQDGAPATFEGGARISTTTLIIILLLVIIILILL